MGKWIFFALFTLSQAHASCEDALTNPLAGTRAEGIYAGLVEVGARLDLYLTLTKTPGVVTFASRAQLEGLKAKIEDVKGALRSIDVATENLEPYQEQFVGLRDAVRRGTVMEVMSSIPK